MEQQENTRLDDFRVEDWKCCKDKVFVEAIGIEMNKDLIPRIPHRLFGGDVACIYRIDISRKSIHVVNAMLERWGITGDELHRTALGNTMKKYPAVMMPVGTALKELTQKKIDMEIEDSPLMVITNKASLTGDTAYGASTIFYPAVQDKISEYMKNVEDVYLIPSSVQEWLLCPKHICQEPEIEAFIKYMNKQMPKGLRLSDHLHHLDPVTRELTCPNYQPDLTRNADVLTVKPKVHRSRLCR